MKTDLVRRNNSIHLIIQYFRCSSVDRQVEIDTCLSNNLLNEYITTIHLLTEEMFDIKKFKNNEKISQTVVTGRLTFEMAFAYANNVDAEGEYIWILSNADIYFDESLKCLGTVEFKNTVIALSRWDLLSDGNIVPIPAEHAHGSQDAWIFKTPIPVANMEANFNLGIPGCDNKILYELIKAGMIVANPSEVLRAIHIDLASLKNIDEKTQEYAQLRTRENIDAGIVAPGPYQYFLFPTSSCNSHSESTYQIYIEAIKLLTQFDEMNVLLQKEIAVQQKEIAAQQKEIAAQQINIKQLNIQKIELDDKFKQVNQALYDIINSKTWKATYPFRRFIDKYKNIKYEKKDLIAEIKSKFSRSANLSMTWIDIVNTSNLPVAIITCAFEFDELVNQRPINFAKELAAIGYLVLYVPWQWGENHKIKAAYREVMRNIVQIPMYELIKNISKLDLSPKDLNLCFITIPSEEYVRALPDFRKAHFTLIYDVMDDWEEFNRVGQATWYRRDCEEATILSSDVVSVVSFPLKDKFSYLRSDIYLIGNGLTPTLLGKENAKISCHIPHKTNNIIVGYFGHMTDSWLDWDSIIAMCTANDDIEVQLIGYGLSAQTRETMKKCSNITYLGMIKPSELHAVVKDWHVGIIPFKIGKLSAAVDPIKIYEYLYFGLPSVVAGISSIKNYPGVYYCNESADLVSLIRKAYSDKINGYFNSVLIDKFVTESTWERRVKCIVDVIKNNLTVRSLYD